MDEAEVVEARMKPKEPIPEFKSWEEEAEFWGTHDFTDYREGWEPVQVHFAKNLSEGITIRLDSDAMQRVQDEATERGIDAST